ncbi:MAG: hypothetical protein KJ964_01530 [Verrucomicrobia bacterium]|nr:hypothetical protein [Verrucomicrobiota bacterium]MBU1735070.1 hypothetical protein [Verrucomicrobiota bacterium]MBU1857945.1 hypothetical protein [Verrucomicrobiota bacterium]
MLPLRICLFAVAFGGIMVLPTLFFTWPDNTAGARIYLCIYDLPASMPTRLVEYWVYMFFACNVAIGAIFLFAGLCPRKNRQLITVLALILILLGLAVMFHAWRLQLALNPYIFDLICCWVFGPLILYFNLKHNNHAS